MCIDKANGSVPSLQMLSPRIKYDSSCPCDSLQGFWNHSSKNFTYLCTWHCLDFSSWLFFGALSQSSLSVVKRGSFAFLDQLFVSALCVPRVYKSEHQHLTMFPVAKLSKNWTFSSIVPFQSAPTTTVSSTTCCQHAYNSRPPYKFVFEFDAMIFPSTWELFVCWFRASFLPL
jgi:hypothetical protein